MFSKNRKQFFYQEKQKKLNFTKRIIYVSFFIVIFFQIFTSFFFSPYVVINDNMYPTAGLDPNQWVWIDKVSYGLLKPMRNNRPDNRYTDDYKVMRGDIVGYGESFSQITFKKTFLF